MPTIVCSPGAPLEYTDKVMPWASDVSNVTEFIELNCWNKEAVAVQKHSEQSRKPNPVIIEWSVTTETGRTLEGYCQVIENMTRPAERKFVSQVWMTLLKMIKWWEPTTCSTGKQLPHLVKLYRRGISATSYYRYVMTKIFAKFVSFQCNVGHKHDQVTSLNYAYVCKWIIYAEGHSTHL